MSASGITASEECITCFNEMQLKHKYGYIIMSIKDKKKVVIEEKGDPFPQGMTQAQNEEVFNTVRAKLVENELDPKFLLFDFKMDTKEGRREKIAFINWCSDNCHVNKRTIQGSTSDGLKKVFQGLGAALQINACCDLSYNEIVPELARK